MTDTTAIRTLELIGAVRDLKQHASRRLNDRTAVVRLDDLSAVEKAADQFVKAMLATLRSPKI